MSAINIKPPQLLTALVLSSFVLVFATCEPPNLPVEMVPVNIIVKFPNDESPSSFRPEFSVDRVQVIVGDKTASVPSKGNLFMGSCIVALNAEESISVTGYVGAKVLFESTPSVQKFSVTKPGDEVSVNVSYLPFVRSVDPADGKASVPTNKSILISFSAAVDTNSIDSTSVILREANAELVPGVFKFLDSTRVMFIPERRLTASQSYSLLVTDNVKDKGKKTLIRSHSAYFTTK